MIAVYALIYVPILLFVIAFLYETYLSIIRLNGKNNGSSYVDATWETTHTILVFGVVMMIMLFTRNLDVIASYLFLPAFTAISFLFLRGICYLQIFYTRQTSSKQSLVDWIFMLSHLGAAVSLVWAVVAFSYVLLSKDVVANTQFIPAFLVGLVIILSIVILPLTYLYLGKKK